MGVTVVIIDIKGNKRIQKEVNNIDQNLMRICRKMVDKRLMVSFANYYRSYSALEYGDVFPFILKDDKYIWHVPAQEVSIRDFMITHNINDGGNIIINEEERCGAGFEILINDIIIWVPFIWMLIKELKEANEVSNLLLHIYHSLIGKNNKVGTPYELMDVIYTNDKWTMKELKRRTMLDDDVIEITLMNCGYSKEGEQYKKVGKERTKIDDDYDDSITDIKKECWGDYIDYDETEIGIIKRSINHINKNVTGLMIQSEYEKTNAFEDVMEKINKLLVEWRGVLVRGSKLQFISLKADDVLELLSEDRISVLHNNLNDLWSFIYSTGTKEKR